jgi:hypothetical protein
MAAEIGRFRNPQAIRLHAIITAGGVPLGLLFGVPTGAVGAMGWVGTLVILLGIALLANIGISFVLFTSVEIGAEEVTFRSLFRKLSVHRSEVQRVILDPPVHTLSLEWSWSERQSVLTIHRRGKNAVKTGAMAEGLKLRIAQALDPSHFPALQP